MSHDELCVLRERVSEIDLSRKFLINMKFTATYIQAFKVKDQILLAFSDLLENDFSLFLDNCI